jgi:hypothetical protein
MVLAISAKFPEPLIMNRASIRSILTSAALALAVAGCGTANEDVDKLDGKLTGKGDADPALTASLEDQIMVDPSLSGKANEDAIRPASEPFQSPVPADQAVKEVTGGAQTLGELASQQAKIAKDSFNGCGLNVSYSAEYAARLPADLPMPASAQVIEAAGSDDNGCRLRAVSHSIAQPIKDVAAYYAQIATRAGYRPVSGLDGKAMMVSGKRAADGGAFYVILTPVGAGTTADLVVNNGR